MSICNNETPLDLVRSMVDVSFFLEMTYIKIHCTGCERCYCAQSTIYSVLPIIITTEYCIEIGLQYANLQSRSDNLPYSSTAEFVLLRFTCQFQGERIFGVVDTDDCTCTLFEQYLFKYLRVILFKES